jgi:hypothetical protein
MIARRILAAGLLAASLAACSSDVDWSKYAPGVKSRIDGLAAQRNCGGLQREFDNADANGNPDLMGYIDGKLESAGCYR